MPNRKPTYKKDTTFCKVYPHVLKVEGGYVNDPRDRGGATNHGIAYNYNVSILRDYGINSPGSMRQLTKEQALDIYYRKYWTPSKAPKIQDDALALVYFDHAVNAGIGSANSLLNKIDSKHWYYEGNGKNVGYFNSQVCRYILERAWFYCRLRQFPVYGLGWFNRLRHIIKALETL